jgi:hypothetical protein
MPYGHEELLRKRREKRCLSPNQTEAQLHLPKTV